MNAQILEYHLWANQLVLNHLKNLPGEICFQQVQSVFPTLYDTLYHMYQVDYVWLRALKGDSFEKIIEGVNQLKEENADRSMDQLEEDLLQLGKKYHEFIDGLENLNETTVVNHPRFGTLTTTYFELLQHVVNHGTYHRGNITAVLRQLGHKGVPTDYVYYLYEKANFEADI
ncbi:DinB family protein [Neobacillus citreus]|uniref:Damage-inducible protein DinB n=1 Tax=Neobacillus citreus TaxID=2833578 RepID=A0A942T5I6_9BACI|nr:DinB family protein [Neobacillus citreus]MCH6268019.1 DinB family protein [Neobacillus citreus]